MASNVNILASRLFDPSQGKFLSDQTITVSPKTGRILVVRPSALPDDLVLTNVLDLRGLTVLPGFVDTHVHLFLHPYQETSWLDQVTRESIPERTIRAVTHARNTLMAGFTSVRDLGTEGAGDADIALRECISTPKSLIPGPRYFCASRAIVATGSYGPKGPLHLNAEGVDGATGADAVDGPDECRKAVRRQIGAGADWIKIYADYPHRSRIAVVSPAAGTRSLPLFQVDELKAIIDTAHSLGVKVAAHAISSSTIKILSGLGIDSIEHGIDLDPDAFESIRDHHITWNPTLAAYASFSYPGSRWEVVQKTFKQALTVPGLKIACGGDTGVFSHGENALEMKWMVRLGADWKRVLAWATLGGWECIRGSEWDGEKGVERIKNLDSEEVVGDNDIPFGWIRSGFAADIIATSGDLEADFESAVSSKSIMFVMKGGKVFKSDGRDIA